MEPHHDFERDEWIINIDDTDYEEMTSKEKERYWDIIDQENNDR